MAELPSDPFASAVVRSLRSGHREMAKQLEGLDDAAINWRPGAGTNSICETLGHVLDGERSVISSITGAEVPMEAKWDSRGTLREIQARLEQADGDLDTYLTGLTMADLPKEAKVFNRDSTVSLGIVIALTHTAEHLGHISLTRQLWDQYGVSGVIKGTEG